MENMGKVITPRVWGEDSWRFIHVVALGFPNKPDEATKAKYKLFYESLQHVLPCATCRQGYASIISSNPIRLDSTEDLFIWTVEVHNAVNRKLGHDVMSEKWIRETYIFRDHEKDDKSSCSQAGPLTKDNITIIVVASLCLSIVVCTIVYFAFSKQILSATSVK